MELSLETDAETKSPSTSVTSGLLGIRPGFGSGRHNDDFEHFSDLCFVDILIPESVRPMVAGCTPGRGSGCA